MSLDGEYWPIEEQEDNITKAHRIIILKFYYSSYPSGGLEGGQDSPSR